VLVPPEDDEMLHDNLHQLLLLQEVIHVKKLQLHSMAAEYRNQTAIKDLKNLSAYIGSNWLVYITYMLANLNNLNSTNDSKQQHKRIGKQNG
jgi:hypothetical protein